MPLTILTWMSKECEQKVTMNIDGNCNLNRVERRSWNGKGMIVLKGRMLIYGERRRQTVRQTDRHRQTDTDREGKERNVSIIMRNARL